VTGEGGASKWNVVKMDQNPSGIHDLSSLRVSIYQLNWNIGRICLPSSLPRLSARHLCDFFSF